MKNNFVIIGNTFKRHGKNLKLKATFFISQDVAKSLLNNKKVFYFSQKITLEKWQIDQIDSDKLKQVEFYQDISFYKDEATITLQNEEELSKLENTTICCTRDSLPSDTLLLDYYGINIIYGKKAGIITDVVNYGAQDLIEIKFNDCKGLELFCMSELKEVDFNFKKAILEPKQKEII